MAFCNSCGTTLEAGTKFCNKCGAVASGSAVSPAAPSAAPGQSSGALKIVLIVVGVLVLLFIVGIGASVFIGWRIARHTRVQNRNGDVRVETPFGTVETTQDADEAVRNLGIDLYPGAHVIHGSTSRMSIGGMHTVAADLESSDSADKVADFYRSKFPNANFSSLNNGHYSIVSTDKKTMITINIEPRGDTTRIHIANITKPGSD